MNNVIEVLGTIIQHRESVLVCALLVVISIIYGIAVVVMFRDYFTKEI